MSRYSAEKCSELIRSVTGTEKSIFETGAQLTFWKRHAHEIVKTWDEAFRQADMDKRMVLLWLVDNIVQTSKPHGRQFLDEFNTMLPEAFKHMMKHSSADMQRKLARLVKVWRDRTIWGNKTQAVYETLVRGVEPEAPAPSPEKGPVKAAAGDPYALLNARQRDIVKLSKEAQDLMKADAKARAALDEATSAVRPCTCP